MRGQTAKSIGIAYRQVQPGRSVLSNVTLRSSGMQSPDDKVHYIPTTVYVHTTYVLTLRGTVICACPKLYNA